MSQGVTTAVTRPAVVRRRLAGIEGLEHLPKQGPFVLISNHTSFADHFFYEALLFAVRGEHGMFLTKAESFTGPRAVWFESMGAVPVDRSRPARELLDITDGILGSGRVLVVYPEGTRNPDPSAMLAFKDGGFRFAERAGVPVIPAAIWGAQDILPIGSRLPHAHQAAVVFGPPLTADPALSRAAKIRDLTARGEQAVFDLLARAQALGPDDRTGAAQHLAAQADAVLELSLAGTDTVAPTTRHRQAALLLSGARTMDPACLDAEVTAARLAGLRALEGGWPLRLPRLLSVRTRAARALRRDPDHLMARYLLGRWHLLAPAVLGGRTAEAVRHLAHAEQLADHDTRYAMAHAEALQTAGRFGEAISALERVIAAPAADLRTRRRRERATTLRADLLAGTPTAQGAVR